MREGVVEELLSLCAMNAKTVVSTAEVQHTTAGQMLELRATKLQECLGQVQRDANEASAVDEQGRAL